ncbi:hypothetical protein [Enterocloster asparagiformis]|nr:hypothetical protein [Enterocloster asparagiformis]MBS6954890.1 hypothetical protein [Enterocloster asparagiformis]
MNDCKDEIMEATIEDFKKLQSENQKFILGYMTRVIEEHQEKESRDKRSA